MNDINRIDIRIINNNKPMELSIIPNSLIYCVNENIKKIDKEYITKILNIICLWKNEYNDNLIDGEKYEIKIYTSKGIDIYKGVRSDQIGYDEFIKLVGELYG